MHESSDRRLETGLVRVHELRPLSLSPGTVVGRPPSGMCVELEHTVDVSSAIYRLGLRRSAFAVRTISP